MSGMGPATPPGGGGGVAWNDTRINGVGVGLTHTIVANAPTGVSSIKTILNDTQLNVLAAHEIDLGLSALGHVGLLMAAKGNSPAQRAILADMGSGPGTAFFVGGTGTFKGINVSPMTTNGSHVGYNYETATLGASGIAVKISTTPAGSLGSFKAFSAIMSPTAQAAARVSDIFEVILDATSGAPTHVDNFNLAYFKRAATASSGSMTSAGSVLKLENQTSPAITDTIDVLKIVQDADAGGYPVSITQNAVVSTNFKKLLDLAGVTLWISDGTNPNSGLSGAAGDICFNGPSGQAFYCAGGISWTGM